MNYTTFSFKSGPRTQTPEYLDIVQTLVQLKVNVCIQQQHAFSLPTSSSLFLKCSNFLFVIDSLQGGHTYTNKSNYWRRYEFASCLCLDRCKTHLNAQLIQLKELLCWWCQGWNHTPRHFLAHIPLQRRDNMVQHLALASHTACT